jgi:hypothetical protein
MKRIVYAALILLGTGLAMPVFAEDETPPAATEDTSAASTDTTAATDTTSATDPTDTAAATDSTPAASDTK